MSTGPAAAAGQALAGRRPGPIDAVRFWLAANRDQIVAALPKHLTPERIARVAITALRVNSRLAECDPASIIAGIMEFSQLGLEINSPLGQAFLIPFRVKGRMTAVPVMGYRGMIDLALRSPSVEHVVARVVHRGDIFEFEYGTTEFLRHRPQGDESAEVTFAYAMAKLRPSGCLFTVLPRAEIEKAKNSSAAVKSGKSDSPWFSDFAAMAAKTAVRRLAKYMPQSPELARAVQIDEAADRGEVLPVVAGEMILTADGKPVEEASWEREVADKLAEVDQLREEAQAL